MNKTHPLVKKLQKLSIDIKKPKSASAVLMLKEPNFRSSKKLQYIANSSAFKISLETALLTISKNSKSSEDKLKEKAEPINKKLNSIITKFLSYGPDGPPSGRSNENFLEPLKQSYEKTIKHSCKELCKIYITLYKNYQDIDSLIKLADVFTNIIKLLNTMLKIVESRFLNEQSKGSKEDIQKIVDKDLSKYTILEYELRKFILVNLLIQKSIKAKSNLTKLKGVQGVTQYYNVNDAHGECLKAMSSHLNSENYQESIDLINNEEKCLKLKLLSKYTNTNISLLE